jgi:predicted TIM-barrel fold metal-dependent hydrolase
MRDHFGAGKLVWGSDMPNLERFCTYRQCVDYVRKHCPFLTASEKDAVLGGNAAQLFGLGK